MAVAPAYDFEIPPKGFQELGELAKLASRLPEIQDVLGKVELTASVDEAATAVSNALGVQREQVRSALRALASLRALRRFTKLSPSALFESLTASLAADVQWKKANLTQWEGARGNIIAALSGSQQDDVLSIQSKTTELTILRQNILRLSRLLVELRPVYNKAADKVVNTVLTTSLFLKYRSGGREREISLAMDAGDLADLRAQCERAERKIATTEREFRDAEKKLTVAGRKDQEDAA